MIIIVEPSWKGHFHAPGNTSTVKVIARAFPNEEVCFFAEETHLAEVRQDAGLQALPNLRFDTLALPTQHFGSPGTISLSRLRDEFRMIRRALRAAPPGENVLLFLISTTATTPFAAVAASLLRRGRVGLQVGYHGNLIDAVGTRPRNPVLRALDTRAALLTRFPVPTRHLLLEEPVREELLRHFPVLANRLDVLPLPVNEREASEQTPLDLSSGPVRVGLLGIGSQAKGGDTFMTLAARLKARWGEAVEFDHIGSKGKGQPEVPEGVLLHPPSSHLPRSEFTERLRRLHYICLPMRRGYYDLSASGTMIDALTFGKPVLATRIPLTEHFFRAYGDIGELRDTGEELEQALDGILGQRDTARYLAQVENLRQAAQSRRLDKLVPIYHRLALDGFPGLLRA
ncbi:glycosyltransferase family protein [Sabulicella glaciei]|uniref:Glycosyltransferase n=1 Tax=Sabulicella glaciei TaxID=2984948 RepID=A0ABT3NUJ6_9PROT|nr:hypothetical protein [Roseococcus sp. MDT2-1-1]MCW8085832.1 hypothetical protein [Roseococcus sp. MDT2-1-1]